MDFINVENYSVFRDTFQKHLTYVPPKIQVLLGEFLHNRQLVMMILKVHHEECTLLNNWEDRGQANVYM